MKVNAKILYEEEYLPTKRHRIPRIRTVSETIPVELREIKKADAQLAMIVTNYQSFLDAKGNDQFGLVDTPILAVDNELFTRKKDMSGALDRGPYPLDAFLKDIESYENRTFGYTSNSKEESIRRLQAFVDSHILIDGEVYKSVAEPRYVVNTFGLGHNHGGTGLFIDHHYNENISSSNYFTALERDKAIAYATDVATRRGDTKSLGRFDSINIQVFMPEMVRLNPALDHGSGNAFLNTLENLVQTSSTPLEAGLLVMSAATSPQMNMDFTSDIMEDGETYLGRPLSKREVTELNSVMNEKYQFYSREYSDRDYYEMFIKDFYKNLTEMIDAQYDIGVEKSSSHSTLSSQIDAATNEAAQSSSSAKTKDAEMERG